MNIQKKELPANKMLTARCDFLTVQKKGQRWVSNGLILQSYGNNLNIIRTGYTVTKKIEKSAVKRNRIKRRLRSVMADIMPFAKNGYDYILVGRKTTLTRPYSKLINDLKWCLKKNNLYEYENKKR